MSDKNKRFMYDFGLYDTNDDDDNVSQSTNFYIFTCLHLSLSLPTSFVYCLPTKLI